MRRVFIYQSVLVILINSLKSIQHSDNKKNILKKIALSF